MKIGLAIDHYRYDGELTNVSRGTPLSEILIHIVGGRYNNDIMKGQLRYIPTATPNYWVLFVIRTQMTISEFNKSKEPKAEMKFIIY